jgi:hypothetical protein
VTYMRDADMMDASTITERVQLIKSAFDALSTFQLAFEGTAQEDLRAIAVALYYGESERNSIF